MTERSHPNTLNLDALSALELVRKMDECGLELFGSDQWGAGLWDPTSLEGLEKGRVWVEQVLADPNGKVLIGGAGTSGRLALLAARDWAEQESPQVVGLMAGGRAAFFRASEGAEDSAELGRDDLETWLTGPGPRLYIGVSCGLSANYVAGQLARILEYPEGRAILIGFNPREEASTRRDLRWGRSFADVLADRAFLERGLAILPPIGPEALTGSTRLKSGTATQILLHLLLHEGEVPERLGRIEEAMREWAEGDRVTLAAAIEAAGNALCGNGSIFYKLEGEAAWYGVLDAGECPPTFGARPEQCVAILNASIPWREAEQISSLANEGPAEREDAVFLGLFLESDDSKAVRLTMASGKPVLEYRVQTSDFQVFRKKSDLANLLVEMALKRALNLISTGAFVRYGKVLGNLMLDLRISNRKLLERAIGIVAKVADCDAGVAKRALAQVLRMEKETADEEVWVSRAFREERVIPRAILTAALGITAQEAESHLEREPSLKRWLGTS